MRVIEKRVKDTQKMRSRAFKDSKATGGEKDDDYDWIKEMNDFFAPAMENYSSSDAFGGSYNDKD